MGLHIMDVLNGIAGATNLGRAIQHAGDEHAKIQQDLQDQQQLASARDIVDRMMFEQHTRPVQNGYVQEQMNQPDQTIGASAGSPDVAPNYQPDEDSSIPPYLRPNADDAPPQVPVRGTGAPASPGLTIPGGPVTIARKPDSGRLVKRKDIYGNEQQGELYSPEEQIQRQSQLQGMQALQDAIAKQNAAVEARKAALGHPGASSVIPDEIADTLGYPRGTRALITELPGLKEQAEGVIQKRRVKLGPGETETELPDPLASPDTAASGAPGALPGQTGAPGAPGARVLATGGAPLPTDDFGKYYLPAYALRLGKTAKTLTPDEQIAAFGQYAESKADPAMRALHQALLQSQVGNMPTKDDAKQIADMIHNHQMAPSQLSLVGGFGQTGSTLKRLVMTDLAGRGDNLQEMEGEYQLAKSPGFQQNIRYMDQVNNSLPRLQNAANQLGNTSMKAINQLVNAGKNQFNNVDLKAFKTDVTFVADEVGKILQGGGTGSGTSDAKLRQAQEVFSSSDSPAAIAAAAKEVKALIGARRQALTRGTYMEEKGGGETTYSMTATGPGGQKIGSNDGKTWFDVQTNKPVK